MGRALSQLGKRVRALRLERKLTQEQAAEGAKLDGKHWQDIEGARTNPTAATLVGVARALKVTLAELFEPGQDKEPPASSARTPSRGGSRSPTPARSRSQRRARART